MSKIASLVLALMAVLGLGLSLTACYDPAPGDYYETEAHGGYPGPAPRTLNRD